MLSIVIVLITNSSNFFKPLIYKMKLILNKWYNFLLTLLFWVFTWETYSALVEKYKLSANQKILLNLSMLSIVIVLITNSSNFFN